MSFMASIMQTIWPLSTWSPGTTKGAAPGELVFVSGHPGSTERDDTVAQLLLERDVLGPAVTEYLQRRINAAQAFSAQGEEQAREVGSTLFYLQNSLKVYLGRRDALADPAILAKKQAEEDDFRAKVNANKEYGNAWDEIAGAEEKMKPEIKGQMFRRTGGQFLSTAIEIVEYVAEVKKPDGERLPEFHEAGLESLKYQLLSPAPIYPATEKLFMTTALKLCQEKMGKDDAFVQAILQGGDVDATVNALVDGTKMGDAAFRKSLLDGGEAAVAALNPPSARPIAAYATPSAVYSRPPEKSWARPASWSMARTLIPTPLLHCG